MSTIMFSDLDLSKLHFHPIQTKGKSKVVDISYSPDSTSWNNRVSMQLCSDNKPLICKWNLSTPRDEDDDGTKRMLELELNGELLAKIEEMDVWILDHALKNAREFWKKDLKKEQVEDRYKELIKRKEGDEPSVLIKIKCPPIEWPTKIGLVDDKWETYKMGSIENLTRHAKVVPIVKCLGLWFAMDKFGISLQCDKILVQPLPVEGFLDSFQLSNEIVMESDKNVVDEPEQVGEDEY